jgi:hypothetical protein
MLDFHSMQVLLRSSAVPLTRERLRRLTVGPQPKGAALKQKPGAGPDQKWSGGGFLGVVQTRVTLLNAI